DPLEFARAARACESTANHHDPSGGPGAQSGHRKCACSHSRQSGLGKSATIDPARSHIGHPLGASRARRVGTAVPAHKKEAAVLGPAVSFSHAKEIFSFFNGTERMRFPVAAK